MTAPDPGFGIYIHWPFCLAKCPYCDFNSHVRERVDEARWRSALLAELDHYAAETQGRTVTSVFFGGGTPSLMAPETAAALIERVRTHWTTTPDLEITLEANPGAAEAARFQALRAAGVNRLSIGVQALDDASLRFLGRIHGRDEAVAAVERARAHFDRFSFDLIYARPGQTVAAWRAELDEALAMAAGHLSVYQLTIEPGTAFHTQARLGALTIPDEDDAAALYETTVERLAAAGLPAYEISNHAAPGQECRHNLTYWRYGDYVGVGPGAHGRLTGAAGKIATRQVRLPEAWLAAVEAVGYATDELEPIDAMHRRDELLMMGLRLAEGVHRTRFVEEVGMPIEAALDRDALARLVDGGFLELDATGLRATAEGRQRLNAVLGALLA
jgi:putative oxygen-independent coproporphyrinogen III oxidase